MALPVPVAIDEQALHRASQIRLMAYASVVGQEGVLGNSHLKVNALGTPGAGIQVMPGGYSVLAKHLGGEYEAYVGKFSVAESVTVSPTTSSGGRSDMVVLRIENPYVSGAGDWPTPADPVNGPYAFIRVLENVSSTYYRASQVNNTWSTIPLARIDRPANTGIVSQAHIKELRSLAELGGTRTIIVENPVVEQPPPPIAQSSYCQFRASEADPSYNPVGGGGSDNVHDYLNEQTTAWQSWPDAATWSVPVPAWATSMDIECAVFGAQILDGDIYGNMQMVVGSSTTALSTVALDYGQVAARHNLFYGVTTAVPSNLRGRQVTFRLQVKHAYNGPGRLDAKGGTTSKLAINFQRYPD